MDGYRLSRTGVARRPYYINLLGIGLWSVEELCYFLYQNPALVDSSVLCGALSRWLAEEFHMTNTALAMDHCMKQGASAADTLLPLLRDAGYLEPEEVRSFMKRLQAVSASGIGPRLKMKGDALVRNKKYGEAVTVYIQAEENTKKSQTAFLASVLHNRAVALMQLLSYDEAYRVFRRALALEPNEARMRSCLLAAGLAKPEQVFYEEAEEMGAAREMIAEVRGTLDRLAAQPIEPPADPEAELQRIRREYYLEAGA